MTTLTETNPRRGRGRRQLILLVLLFVVPLVGAWVVFIYFPDAVRSLGTTNYGKFVHPARSLEWPALKRPSGEPLGPDFLRGKWTYLYFDRSACDSACQRNLWKMRQVRLAQGEDVHRVQRLFVLTDAHDLAALVALLEKQHPALTAVHGSEQDIAGLLGQFAVDGSPAVDAQRVYIVDPLGRLMMYYPPDADPKGMIQDMERLLKVSQIG